MWVATVGSGEGNGHRDDYCHWCQRAVRWVLEVGRMGYDSKYDDARTLSHKTFLPERSCPAMLTKSATPPDTASAGMFPGPTRRASERVAAVIALQSVERESGWRSQTGTCIITQYRCLYAAPFYVESDRLIEFQSTVPLFPLTVVCPRH